MKNLICLLVGLSGAVSLAADEFEPIFDGKTLSGWDGKAGAWEVRDGAIWCTGVSEGKNWLIYRGDEELGDFVLRLEFRWESGNSGVQVRSKDIGDHHVRGYQVEVAQQEKMGLWHHSLSVKEDPAYKERSHLSLAGQKVKIAKDGGRTVEQVAEAEKVQANYKENDWNTLVVRAKGARVVQEINGVVYSDLVDVQKDVSSREGVIALQDHGKGCIVAFRKIELKKAEKGGGKAAGWRSLFNGKDLAGWKANQLPESFYVKNGTIVTHGIHDMAHLYFFGEKESGEKFTNLELRAEVKCEPNSNSGIFVHTTYHETEHFLDYGYEAQVNNTHKNKNKTGGLFAVDDVYESPVKDGEWFDYSITVKGKRIVLKINGEVTKDYTEPENVAEVRDAKRAGRVLNPEGGLIALQAHDPGSVVYYRNIRVRELD